MNSHWRWVAVLVFAGCAQPVSPRLCVHNLPDDGGIPDCATGVGVTQDTCVVLSREQAIIVQHSLPQGVTPYGNDVELTFTSGGFEETRKVPYGALAADDGEYQQALTVFDFPDSGTPLLTVHARILNSDLTVAATVVDGGMLDQKCR